MNKRRYSNEFNGIITALATPFNKDYSIDYNALDKLLQMQIDAGVNGVVICGSTAEAASMSDEEFNSIVEHCISFIKKSNTSDSRMKIIVGLSSNNLDTCIARGRFAKKMGANAVLAVTPFYFRPTQLGMQRYFEEIASAIDMPIILYNVPSRSSSDLHSRTVSKLASVKNIIGLKDATGDISRIQDLNHELQINSETNLDNFIMLSGEDKTFVEFCILGGCGVISVISNAFPDKMVKIYNLCKEERCDEAMQEQFKMYNIMDSVFAAGNPTGIKCALSELGIFQNIVRLPLLPASQENINNIREVVKGK